MPTSIPPHVGFTCPDCDTELDVLETRKSGTGIRRRRYCRICDHRITTYELSSYELEHANDHFITHIANLALHLDRLRALCGHALSHSASP